MSTIGTSTPPDQAAPAVDWTVIRQDHQQSFDPNNPGSGRWTIYFRTRTGVESFVTVEDSAYSPEGVAAAINPKAQAIDAVSELGGS